MVQCGKTKHFESLDKISWNQFFKKIRAITIQCNLVRNALISRKCEKNIAIESNFCNIHTMQCNANMIQNSKHTLWKLLNFIAKVFSQKFRQINVLQKNFSMNWFDEKKMLGWQWISSFSHTHSGVEITEFYCCLAFSTKIPSN